MSTPKPEANVEQGAGVPANPATANFQAEAYRPHDWKEIETQFAKTDPSKDGVLSFKDLDDIYRNKSVPDNVANLAPALAKNFKDVEALDGKPGISKLDIERLTSGANEKLKENVAVDALIATTDAQARKPLGLPRTASSEEYSQAVMEKIHATQRESMGLPPLATDNTGALERNLRAKLKESLGLPANATDKEYAKALEAKLNGSSGY